MSARVVRLDLKECDPEQAVLKVQELLRDQRDLSLLLVEDTAPAVVGHRRAFETLDKSRQVGRLLCVVVGRQPDARDGLRLPSNIQQRTLWVIERTGVDWPLRASAPAKRHDERDSDGLGQLSGLLRLPDVFTRTHEALAEVPFGVAVPGLHVAGISSTGQQEFLQALYAAAKRLLDPMAISPAARAEAGQGKAVVPLRLVREGPIQDAFDEAERAVNDAYEFTGELYGVRSLVEDLPVTGTVVAVGDRLGALHTLLSDLLILVPGDGRITPDRLEAMTARGIWPPPIEEFDEKQGRDLAGWLRESLKRGSSLPRIAESLQERARELEQHKGHTKTLGRICSNSLLHQLRTPRPLPPLQGWLPAAGAVFAALAGLSPFGVASGLVMALLWTLLVALTTIRGPAVRRIEDHSQSLAFNALGSVAGAIVGGLSGPAHLPDIVWAIAVLVAVVGALGTVLYSWRARASQWVRETGLDRAERVLADLMTLLGRVVKSWAGANARLGEADAVNRLRQALTGVQAELDLYSRRMEDELQELLYRPQPLAGYSDTVRHWLGDLVLAALRPVLAGITDGDPQNYRQNAQAETRRLLTVWEHAVNQGGAAEAPSFAVDSPPAAPAITDDDLAILVREAAYDPAGEMWQLCAPGDLGLLNPVTSPRAIRFAPRTAANGETLPPDTALVSSAGHCGVLRLVPLHPQVVEWTWTDTDEDLTGGRR